MGRDLTSLLWVEFLHTSKQFVKETFSKWRGTGRRTQTHRYREREREGEQEQNVNQHQDYVWIEIETRGRRNRESRGSVGCMDAVFLHLLLFGPYITSNCIATRAYIRLHSQYLYPTCASVHQCVG